MITGTPRHEMWRQQYRDNRYARHLSRSELNKRIRDILLNLLIVTPEAKIGMPPNERSASWLEKWTHVLEEMELRYGPHPAGFGKDILHSEPFPDFVSELAEKAAKRMSAFGLKRGEAFIKFGQREFMQRLYQHGRLRIRSASYYSNMEHNGALRDDELTFKLSLALRHTETGHIIDIYNAATDISRDKRVDITFSAPSDYWIYCVTASIEPRLFGDFEADACVIIRDREVFKRRLKTATEAISVDALMLDGPAIYVDPIIPNSSSPFIPLTKYFGYAYQDEYRIFWLPPKRRENLAYLDIEIGCLEDISEVIVLE